MLPSHTHTGLLPHRRHKTHPQTHKETPPITSGEYKLFLRDHPSTQQPQKQTFSYRDALTPQTTNLVSRASRSPLLMLKTYTQPSTTHSSECNTPHIQHPTPQNVTTPNKPQRHSPPRQLHPNQTPLPEQIIVDNTHTRHATDQKG